MGIESIDRAPVLSIAVVNMGMGSKILSEAKKVGISGGTIFLGRGTVKKPILELLGLDEVKKEIVFMISDKKLEERLHEDLTEKFHLDKPNKGILFSSPVNRTVGIRNRDNADNWKMGGKVNMDYEVVFTVVERGLGQEVVDAATAAGSRGATIINARGSGIHENTMFFSMNIEPEKEIVMIIIEKEKSDKIIKSIEEAMHIDEPGKGVMFAMDVTKASGLVKGDK